MSDIGAAPAASPSPAPAPAETVVTPPNPVHTEPRTKPEPKAEEPVKKPSAREALLAAREKQAKAQPEEKAPAKEVKSEAPKATPKSAEPAPKVDQKADPKAEPVKTEAKAADPKAAEKAERERGEHGHFAKSEQNADDQPSEKRAEGDRSAPKRFSQAAREIFDKLGPEHDELRNEVLRMEREQNAGIEKHRPQSQRYETVYKQYDEIARQSGVDAKATLDGYIAIDRKLSNPNTFIEGVGDVLKAKGVTPLQYAQAIMADHQRRTGQAPSLQREQQQQNQQPDVGKLVNDAVRQALAPIQKHLTQQQKSADEDTVQQWAKEKGFEHFDTLRPRIVQIIKEDNLSPSDAYAKALVEAQDSARAFLGDVEVKTPAPAPAKPRADELAAQSEKGSKSIDGAPGPGSETARKTPHPKSSIRDSLKKAIAAAG